VIVVRPVRHVRVAQRRVGPAHDPHHVVAVEVLGALPHRRGQPRPGQHRRLIRRRPPRRHQRRAARQPPDRHHRKRARGVRRRRTARQLDLSVGELPRRESEQRIGEQEDDRRRPPPDRATQAREERIRTLQRLPLRRIHTRRNRPGDDHDLPLHIEPLVVISPQRRVNKPVAGEHHLGVRRELGERRPRTQRRQHQEVAPQSPRGAPRGGRHDDRIGGQRGTAHRHAVEVPAVTRRLEPQCREAARNPRRRSIGIRCSRLAPAKRVGREREQVRTQLRRVRFDARRRRRRRDTRCPCLARAHPHQRRQRQRTTKLPHL
jgi:hypothetical protein